MNNQILSEVFSQLSKKIKKLSDDDVNKIANGQMELKFIEKTERVSSKTTAPSVEIIAIAAELNSMISNDDGMKLLKQHCKRKVDLKILARHLDIPFTTRDTIPKLQEKIIESTIGYRIRAAAIQNQ
jgi:hypothetical protein